MKPVREVEWAGIKYYATGDCSPNKEIVKSIQADLILRCNVCDEPAVAFVSDEPGRLWVNSAVRSYPLVFTSPDRLSLFLDKLRKGYYQKVHQELLNVCSGLDYYCPICDCIYCGTHYEVLPSFDEGFYDCSWATCPRGHRRIMDD